MIEPAIPATTPTDATASSQPKRTWKLGLLIGCVVIALLVLAPLVYMVLAGGSMFGLFEFSKWSNTRLVRGFGCYPGATCVEEISAFSIDSPIDTIGLKITVPPKPFLKELTAFHTPRLARLGYTYRGTLPTGCQDHIGPAQGRYPSASIETSPFTTGSILGSGPCVSYFVHKGRGPLLLSLSAIEPDDPHHSLQSGPTGYRYDLRVRGSNDPLFDPKDPSSGNPPEAIEDPQRMIAFARELITGYVTSAKQAAAENPGFYDLVIGTENRRHEQSSLEHDYALSSHYVNVGKALEDFNDAQAAQMQQQIDGIYRDSAAKLQGVFDQSEADEQSLINKAKAESSSLH